MIRRRSLSSLALFLPLALSSRPVASQVVLGDDQIGYSAPSNPSQELAEVLHRLDEEREKKLRIDSEIQSLESRHSQARERLKEHARTYYRLTKPGLLPVAGGFDALLSHVARVKRFERVLAEDLRATRWLDERAVALRKETGALARRIDAARLNLEALQDRRESTDWGGIRFSASQNAPVNVPTTAAFETSEGRLRVVGDSTAAPRHFGQERGRLERPIDGNVEVRDAQREGGENGLEFHGSPSSQGRAVFDGKVIYAGRQGSYGMTVILDHGDRYFTVYGGLEGVDVQVGDHLSQRARIGNVSRESKALYFEVRRGARALPAREWFGL